MIQAIRARVDRMITTRGAPIVLALDGPSGSGKSTVARDLASAGNATVIPADDFFAAEITAAEWGQRSAAARARDALDWRRLRLSALQPLREGRVALWYPFDFAAGERPDGSYSMSTTSVQREPAPLIILEGAYSTRPELVDLIDLTVLVDAPAAIRRERLAAREGPAFLDAWHRRWDDAEAFYFTHVRPPSSFAIVVDTTRSVQ